MAPIKQNRIIFDNFGGKGYGDNPKYIAEELHSRNSNYELIWLDNPTQNNNYPIYIKPVKINSLKAIYFQSTAQIWIDNIRNNHFVLKRKKQLYIQTWHAPFSPKLLEKDAESTLSLSYIEQAKYDGQIADAIISNSKLLDNQYLRAFWLNENTDILKIGLPRNDFLMNNHSNNLYIRQIKSNLKLPSNAYIILYAPTFRDDFSTNGYKLDFKKIISAFERTFNQPCILLVRFHPNVQNQSDIITYTANIINMTFHPDIQELALISDAIITDYSSSVFDFSMLYKPAFICTLDLKEYEKSRGLLPDFYEFPFPFSKTNEELIHQIYSFNQAEYHKNLDLFYRKYPIYDTGNASIRITDWIENKISKKDR